jgi:hypothetical protein
MTDLSPATQAVLDAFSTYPLRSDHIAEDLVPALATALRAAADQVVLKDGADHWETNVDWAKWRARDDVRDKILAIADELEAVST